MLCFAGIREKRNVRSLAEISLAVLNLIGDHAQRKCLHGCQCLLSARAVRHHSREIKNLGDPPTVVFLLKLDSNDHQTDIVALQGVFNDAPSIRNNKDERLMWHTDGIAAWAMPPRVFSALRRVFQLLHVRQKLLLQGGICFDQLDDVIVLLRLHPLFLHRGQLRRFAVGR